MLEFSKPIPVHTPLGDGYALYATNTGMLENDEWTVALSADGQVRHFLTKDIKVQKNATYGVAQEQMPFELTERGRVAFKMSGDIITGSGIYASTHFTKADNL